MTAPTPLIAGNWKMNGGSAQIAEARAVAAGVSGKGPARVAICPPTP
ncbi:MAG TPA: triose-phosphate isomerase, partial [Phenylobacterium sp.]